MGFFSSLLRTPRAADTLQASTSDSEAVERYEHLLRTATPETIEQVHTEAFERLTPEQRDLLFQKLLDGARTPEERPADASPAALARTATRAEAENPGRFARLLGGQREAGTGDPFGGSLLNAIAAYAIASTVFDAFFFAAGISQLPLVDDSGDAGSGDPSAPVEDSSLLGPDAGWGDFGL
jgi:hypothetical protein